MTRRDRAQGSERQDTGEKIPPAREASTVVSHRRPTRLDGADHHSGEKREHGQKRDKFEA